ncbi:uncharacterized protein EI90DRAFT_3121120 [Cantharellus anzutake]|uniref:uncharacterized protein n=1 Tax=Cantharellus anzutake TaxID=1750568 RepID=UPI001903B701|nr:uncharacterized protein EI90DRAFT_3121120 [Cantharellus anzutake]KAF8334682.1 hypothetical protein EI90DRAFT_3121120 [Cantharellus anzutake]
MAYHHSALQGGETEDWRQSHSNLLQMSSYSDGTEPPYSPTPSGPFMPLRPPRHFQQSYPSSVRFPRASVTPESMSVAVRDYTRHTSGSPVLLGAHHASASISVQDTCSDARFSTHSSNPELNTDRFRESSPLTSKGTRLRSVRELPNVYQGIFGFPLFNAIQSTCFDMIMKSGENLVRISSLSRMADADSLPQVLSAPTGSGKTVVFELAIIKLFMDNSPSCPHGPQCVYIAPMKALCTERFNDWTKKFSPLGIDCCEMTGDTAVEGRDAWRGAKKCSIIITTPEKWDALTRNWHDTAVYTNQISLFLVHILSDPRGATLEVCISRMKTRMTNPRFVLVSATVPNIEDIAEWIRYGSPPHATSVFRAGSTNFPWTRYFLSELDRSLTSLIAHVKSRSTFMASRANEGRTSSSSSPRSWIRSCFLCFSVMRITSPSLYFVLPERVRPIFELSGCCLYYAVSGVVTCADKIAAAYLKLTERGGKLPWNTTRETNASFEEPKLSELVSHGIAKIISVVVATSTLAVGVNMPAHTVVIHGTVHWADTQWEEYSSLEVMQMIGRAGRPQFDKEGVAIILCDAVARPKYEALESGNSVFESHLHRNLIEHVASEVALGTIVDEETAKKWLLNSFLFQRIQRNPAHYSGLNDDSVQGSWRDRLNDIVEQTLATLEEASLISRDSARANDKIRITEAGEIMTKYYIRFSTMCAIQTLPEEVNLRQLFEMLSQADELTELARLRVEEKRVFNEIREHNDIRFPVKKVEKTPEKVLLLLQAALGGIPLTSKDWKGLGHHATLDAANLLRQSIRVAKGKFSEVLAQHGITTIGALRGEKAHRVELLLNKKHPFGRELIQQAASLPDYIVGISEDNVVAEGGAKPVLVTLSVSISLHHAMILDKVKALGYTSVLTTTSDCRLIDFRRIPTKGLVSVRSFVVTASLEKPSQSVIVQADAEKYAGLSVFRTYKPTVSPGSYPILMTKPPKDDIEVPSDFWDISSSEIDAMLNGDATNPNPEVDPVALHTETPELRKKSAKAVELPHGNFPCCDHNCKDKSSCRHHCRREGSSKAPNRNAANTVRNRNPSTSTNKGTPKPTDLRQKPKLDQPRIDLEELHRNALSEPAKSSLAKRTKVPLSGQPLTAKHPSILLETDGMSDDLNDMSHSQGVLTIDRLPRNPGSHENTRSNMVLFDDGIDFPPPSDISSTSPAMKRQMSSDLSMKISKRSKLDPFAATSKICIDLSPSPTQASEVQDLKTSSDSRTMKHQLFMPDSSLTPSFDRIRRNPTVKRSPPSFHKISQVLSSDCSSPAAPIAKPHADLVGSASLDTIANGTLGAPCKEPEWDEMEEWMANMVDIVDSTN